MEHKISDDECEDTLKEALEKRIEVIEQHIEKLKKRLEDLEHAQIEARLDMLEEWQRDLL